MPSKVTPYAVLGDSTRLAMRLLCSPKSLVAESECTRKSLLAANECARYGRLSYSTPPVLAFAVQAQPLGQQVNPVALRSIVTHPTV